MNHDRYDIDGLVPSIGVFEPVDVSDLQTFMSERNMAGQAVSIVGGSPGLKILKTSKRDSSLDLALSN